VSGEKHKCVFIGEDEKNNHGSQNKSPRHYFKKTLNSGFEPTETSGSRKRKLEELWRKKTHAFLSSESVAVLLTCKIS
jgi:hypothetical protein